MALNFGLTYPAKFSLGNIYNIWARDSVLYVIKYLISSSIGCYRFSNEKFMLYLDNDICPNPCTRNFSAPIFSENSRCNIVWSESTIMHSEMIWQNATKMTNTKPISVNIVSKDLKMLMVRISMPVNIICNRHNKMLKRNQ